MKTIRFGTLIKRLGIPAYVDGNAELKTWKIRNAFWHAILNHKILTIHHGETSRELFWAEPGKYAVNVVGFAIFNKPIPDDIGFVVGVEQHLADLKELMQIVGKKKHGQASSKKRR